MKYWEWPTDEHDEFIKLAQTLDTLTELAEAFPHRTLTEVMEKAESMGCLEMLVLTERNYAAHDRWLEEIAGVNRTDF